MKKPSPIDTKHPSREFSRECAHWHLDTWESCGRKAKAPKTGFERTGILKDLTLMQISRIISLATGMNIIIDISTKDALSVLNQEIRHKYPQQRPSLSKNADLIVYQDNNGKPIKFYENGSNSAFALDCSSWWDDRDCFFRYEILNAVEKVLNERGPKYIGKNVK